MALNRCVRSSKVVRELVERLEEKENKERQKQLCLPVLTQSHALIRDQTDYGRFFETHAEKTVLTNQPGEAIFLLSGEGASPNHTDHPHAVSRIGAQLFNYDAA